MFVLCLALTSGASPSCTASTPRPHRALELAVLVAASGCATITRYVALKTLVFARGGRPRVSAAAAPGHR